MPIYLGTRNEGNKQLAKGLGIRDMGESDFKGFESLDVYKRSLESAKEVIFNIVPRLPKHEAFDLADQIKRACKAIPTLIAEGYAKKFQRKGFQKYLIDALAEANEMTVHLTFAKLYLSGQIQTIDRLIEQYSIVQKQIYRLKLNWDNLNNIK